MATELITQPEFSATAGEIPIADIKTGKRFRQDVGDIKALAASIEQLGLLQPVVLDSSHRLIAGQRRVEAVRLLGRQTIPFVVATDVENALHRIQAERDENTCRKDFLPSEAVSLGESLEELERKEAKKRQKKRGGTAPGRKKKTGGKFPQVNNGKIRDKVGSALGMSGRTFEKAKAVVHSGDKELVAEMDRTGRVNGVFHKLKIRRQVEKLNTEPPPLPTGPFRVIVADPPMGVQQAARRFVPKRLLDVSVVGT